MDWSIHSFYWMIFFFFWITTIKLSEKKGVLLTIWLWLGNTWPAELLKVHVLWWLYPSCGGVTWMQNLKVSLVGAQGYQRFPLSKPVLGQNIGLDAVPAYRAYIQLHTYLVSAFTAHSTRFSPNLQWFNVFKSSESEFYVWQEYILFHPDMTLRGSLGVKQQVAVYRSIHLHTLSPIEPLWLTGR